jgi:hypothetical protein
MAKARPSIESSKIILHAYTSKDPSVWAHLLPLAQFAYNNSQNHTTHMSPNQLLHGFDCKI